MDSDTIAHLYSEICSGSDESKLKVNWHTNTRFTESEYPESPTLMILV